MELKQKIYILYLISIFLAVIEAGALIINGNSYNFYLVFLGLLIAIAVMFQITLQLDKVIDSLEYIR